MGPGTVGELVHEHYRVVYRFACRLSGSTADAEDLTQQAFLIACRKVEQLRERSRARSWLFTIVRNEFLKLRDHDPGGFEPFEDELVAEEPEEWPPEIDEEKLQAALDEMPEAFRTPVLLYYFEDLCYKEIAALLEVPIGTVMSRLARGKRFLREKLTVREPAIIPDRGEE